MNSPIPGILLLACLLTTLLAHAASENETFVYKRVGALEIKADVVPAPGFAGPRPVVVWIHGGALISGSRERDFRQDQGGWLWLLHEQHGIWPWAVSGWNPFREAERYLPFMPVKNVTADFPPTLLVHGQSDTDVPHAQSELMAAEFKRLGDEHAFITVPAAEHGLRGGNPALVEKSFRAAADFLLAHFTRPAPLSP